MLIECSSEWLPLQGMDRAQTTSWLSDARFAPYLASSNGDHNDAVALYVWNARISAALFETLHHVEVLLRNAIDAQFPPVGSSAPLAGTWLDDAAILTPQSRDRVQEAVERLIREGKAPTRGRVVAGLSFGFWRALFDRRYAGLWTTYLHRAFPAGTGDRGEIAALMSTLLPFRNRIAHHETILQLPIADRYNDMIALAARIDPHAAAWIDAISRVRSTLGSRPA
jgi:hypothetical protein